MPSAYSLQSATPPRALAVRVLFPPPRPVREASRRSAPVRFGQYGRGRRGVGQPVQHAGTLRTPAGEEERDAHEGQPGPHGPVTPPAYAPRKPRTPPPPRGSGRAARSRVTRASDPLTGPRRHRRPPPRVEAGPPGRAGAVRDARVSAPPVRPGPKGRSVNDTTHPLLRYLPGRRRRTVPSGRRRRDDDRPSGRRSGVLRGLHRARRDRHGAARGGDPQLRPGRLRRLPRPRPAVPPRRARGLDRRDRRDSRRTGYRRRRRYAAARAPRPRRPLTRAGTPASCAPARASTATSAAWSPCPKGSRAEGS